MKRAFHFNGDGFGVVFQGKDGSINVEKTFHLPRVQEIVAKLQGRPYVMHFRWATHGSVDYNNIHPFEISEGLYMVHNGVLDIPVIDERYSDTWHFAQMLKATILKDDPEGFTLEHWRDSIASAIGKGNKLAFMRNDGSIVIINRNQGLQLEGKWWSNSNTMTKLEYFRAMGPQRKVIQSKVTVVGD